MVIPELAEVVEPDECVEAVDVRAGDVALHADSSRTGIVLAVDAGGVIIRCDDGTLYFPWTDPRLAAWTAAPPF